MELRHLRYFCSVAESGGVGASARRLYLSPSAISETIKDLEEELGVQLFNRKFRSIRLTPSGKAFLHDVKMLLALADKAVENVRRLEKGEIGSLTIGFFDGAFGSFAPKLISDFRRRNKGIGIHLSEMVPALQAEAILSGAIDAGFTRPGPELQLQAIQSEHFQTEQLYAVVPQKHKLARNRNLSVHDLAEEPFVINERRFSPALHDRIFMLCSAAGFSPRIHATASASSGVAALVEAGEGIAILSQPLQSAESTLKFIPLPEKDATIDIVLAWKRDHKTPALQAFLAHVRSSSKGR